MGFLTKRSKTLREISEVASWPVYVIGITASMGGFMFGADTGQISGFLIMKDYLRRFATDRGNGIYTFNNVREGLIVGLISIGALFGAICAAPLSNKYGRRTVMIAAALIFWIGNSVQITAQWAWFQIMIGRFISGLGIGSLSALVPVYISETVPKEVRGSLVAAYQLFITLGILVSYVINLGTSRVEYNSGCWRGAMAIQYLWSGILILGMLFLPESPRWLMTHDRHKDTIRALRFIAGKKNRDNKDFINSEFDEILQMVEVQRTMPKTRWYGAFVPSERVLYRTLLGVALGSFQQLTGANFFFYYGASVFQSVGISNPYVTQIIMGAVNTVCTFPGLYFIEKYGRRRPLIYGGIWQALWLVVYGTVGTAGDPSSTRIGAVLIVASCMFIAGFASTWGPGVWVAIGELFPLRVRAQSAAMATVGNWVFNFLLTFFTPFIVSSISYKYGYVFAGCNLLAVLVVFFFYYESSNLSLEHIDMMYNDPNVKPWKSSKWVPPGMISRTEMMPDGETTTETESDLEKPLESRRSLDGGLFARNNSQMSTRSFRDRPVGPLNRGASESLAPVDEYEVGNNNNATVPTNTTPATGTVDPSGRPLTTRDSTTYTRDTTSIRSPGGPRPVAVHDHLYARDEEERAA